LLELPEELPRFDPPLKSSLKPLTLHTDLTPETLLRAANLIAESFATREPMARHLRPSRRPAEELKTSSHKDALGTVESWGDWDTRTFMKWFVRLFLVTDATSPYDAIAFNEDVAHLSLLGTSEDGVDLCACLTETFTWPPHPLRQNDPYLNFAISRYYKPIIQLLSDQDRAAVGALSRHYPAFAKALDAHKVAHLFMIARTDAASNEYALSLFVSQFERVRDLGFEFCLIECSSEWSGAVCKACAGTPVHFAPFRAKQVVKRTMEAGDDEPHSADGFLAAKDSGCLFYVIRF